VRGAGCGVRGAECHVRGAECDVGMRRARAACGVRAVGGRRYL
jgi:hypothetical protein